MQQHCAPVHSGLDASNVPRCLMSPPRQPGKTVLAAQGGAVFLTSLPSTLLPHAALAMRATCPLTLALTARPNAFSPLLAAGSECSVGGQGCWCKGQWAGTDQRSELKFEMRVCGASVYTPLTVGDGQRW